ncbi:MAG: RNA polymerase sigma factor [Verrucomicrobia bacterium]|nr:RNA polymerase sigma factor [Verrucomicrobiota bacterium]
MADDEQSTVKQARAGSPDAWDALFRRYQLPLYVYVFELVQHEQTSLDLVQETFINAARHLDGLRDDAKFGSWLFRIAHQKCVQHWRKQKSSPDFAIELDDESSEEQLDPREMLIRREQEEKFMTLLSQLPPAHRSVLLLHYVEDFSLEEIAVITGARLGTVKSRLHYARNSLRRILGEQSGPN